MEERAALLWEVPADDVDFTDGVFICSLNTDDRLTFKEMAGEMAHTGGTITCSASDVQGDVGPQLAGNIVDVEVDPDTGKVEILRYTTFMDVGQVVHRSNVEGQMQGGVLQGEGWALNEEYYYTEDGKMANSSLLDYRMPTTTDLPMIDTVIIEVPNPRHPFGIRGVGERPSSRRWQQSPTPSTTPPECNSPNCPCPRRPSSRRWVRRTECNQPPRIRK